MLGGGLVNWLEFKNFSGREGWLRFSGGFELNFQKKVHSTQLLTWGETRHIRTNVIVIDIKISDTTRAKVYKSSKALVLDRKSTRQEND